MQTHVVITKCITDRLELLGDRPWGHWNSTVRFAGEHEGVGRDLHSDLSGAISDDVSLRLEDRERDGVERDAAFGVSLGVLLLESTRHLDYRPLDGEGLASRVEVAPTKGADFSATCTG